MVGYKYTPFRDSHCAAEDSTEGNILSKDNSRWILGGEFSVKMFSLTILLVNQEVHLKLAKSIKAWETFVRAMSRASVTDWRSVIFSVGPATNHNSQYFCQDQNMLPSAGLGVSGTNWKCAPRALVEVRLGLNLEEERILSIIHQLCWKLSYFWMKQGNFLSTCQEDRRHFGQQLWPSFAILLQGKMFAKKWLWKWIAFNQDPVVQSEELRWLGGLARQTEL